MTHVSGPPSIHSDGAYKTSIESPLWSSIDSFIWLENPVKFMSLVQKNPLIKLPGPLASDEFLWPSLPQMDISGPPLASDGLLWLSLA